MESGRGVNKVQFAAQFREGLVNWSLSVQTDDGERHIVPIREGEEVPLLLQLCRNDKTLYFDARSQTLRTGWSAPGDAGE